MTVISKFRTEYWISNILQYLGDLIIIGLCIYFSFEDGKLEFNNALLWVAGFGIIGLILHILFFFFNELKKLSVNDNGIEIKYLISLKKVFIKYTEIKKFSTTHITQRQGAGRSKGYQELEIHLVNGEIITFNEDQFANYSEIKKSIYHYWQNQSS